MAGKVVTEPGVEPTGEPQAACEGIIAEGAADIEAVQALGDAYKSLADQLARVVVGQERVIEQVMVAMFCNGHALLVGVPGLAKTLMVSTLAEITSLTFKRIQFTPDLMPSDITGTNVIDERPEGHREFRFVRGPVFANIVLADEINRTTPRTQSSLLEAMNDSQISVDGVTHRLPRPFMVIATQNPIEYEGTYPLPESQLDRFLMRLRIGYPDMASERDILYSQKMTHPLATLEPVISGTDVLIIQQEIRSVTLDEVISSYILEIADRTRKSSHLEVGVSPRGSLSVFRAAQALAYVEGRDYVIPDDVKTLAGAVLAHRVISKGFAHENGSAYAADVIDGIVKAVPVPV